MELPYYQKTAIQTGTNNSVYSSFFFRRDIIDEFETRWHRMLREGDGLSQYYLYNKDDLINIALYNVDQTNGYRYEQAVNKTNTSHGSYTEESIEAIEQMIKHLTLNVCSDITETYAEKALSSSLGIHSKDFEHFFDKYDILIISKKIDNIDKLDTIAGFIIVELGECKMYKNAYSIKLICTNKKIAVKGIGSILMGAYLYSILSHPQTNNNTNYEPLPNGIGRYEGNQFTSSEPLNSIQHVAVLELANGYINAGGLCMYEKFGFKYDPDMYGTRSDNNNSNANANNRGMYGLKKNAPLIETRRPRPSTPAVTMEDLTASSKKHCFYDLHNIPMKIDFNTHPSYLSVDKKKLIIDIVSGISNDETRTIIKSKICNSKFQKLLGYLKYILIQLSYYTLKQIKTDYVIYHTKDKTDDMNAILKELFNNKLTEPNEKYIAGINSIIEQIESIESSENIPLDIKKLNEILEQVSIERIAKEESKKRQLFLIKQRDSLKKKKEAEKRKKTQTKKQENILKFISEQSVQTINGDNKEPPKKKQASTSMNERPLPTFRHTRSSTRSSTRSNNIPSMTPGMAPSMTPSMTPMTTRSRKRPLQGGKRKKYERK
jgi:hypothetical protein